MKGFFSAWMLLLGLLRLHPTTFRHIYCYLCLTGRFHVLFAARHIKEART